MEQEQELQHYLVKEAYLVYMNLCSICDLLTRIYGLFWRGFAPHAKPSGLSRFSLGQMKVKSMRLALRIPAARLQGFGVHVQSILT